MIQGTPTAVISSRLKHWTSEELQLAAKDMEALRETRGWQTVVELLTEAHQAALTRLIRGTAKTDAAVYAKELGMLDGITLAADAVETILAVAKAARAEADRLAELADREA